MISAREFFGLLLIMALAVCVCIIHIDAKIETAASPCPACECVCECDSVQLWEGTIDNPNTVNARQMSVYAVQGGK